jgi:hypothetical protein
MNRVGIGIIKTRNKRGKVILLKVFIPYRSMILPIQKIIPEKTISEE